MTGPDNGQAGTRPISVAELLAKNGTIGSPPVGGRRRRRRGNSDAVTVAELTGEIPVVRTGEIPVVTGDGGTDDAEDEDTGTEDTGTEDTATEAPSGGDEPAAAVVEAAPEAAPEAEVPVAPQRSAEPLPRRGRATEPERSHYPRPERKRDRTAPPPRGRGVGAELMSPDPIDLDDADAELAADLDESAPDELGLGLGLGDASYLRSGDDTLFGGDSVADDAARRRGAVRELDDLDDLTADGADVLDETDEDAADELSDDEPPTRGQKFLHGAGIALQSIVAVAFGGGLFIAFDQLWKWNSLIALVLGVLVILGLVVGVRIVRKTEDIGSTLTAVAVGALVTFGPLALLQAS